MLPKEIQTFFVESPYGGVAKFCMNTLSVIVYFAILIAAVWVLQKINQKAFRYIEEKRGAKIHLQFLERVINIAIVVVIIIIPLAGDKIGTSILGSAAVLTAVVGFAAQDVIKDVLSGLLISIYKPFDIGDKIELDDGTIGIVESITMRHVVVIRLDNLRDVIPNSKINDIPVINYSIGMDARSELFRFQISYDSDIDLAKEVIAKTVKDSAYTLPGLEGEDGRMTYGPVLFIEMGDSALTMAVRIYFKRDENIFRVRDDINSSVFKALKKAGIEIPYSYTNVIVKKE